MRRMTVGAALALGTLCVAAVVAGCSGHSGSDSREAAASAPSAALKAAGPAYAAAGGTGSSGSSVAGQATSLDVTSPRARIRTADITVRITRAADVAGRADAAELIATRAGGEVDSDDRTTGSAATASLVLRVPPAALSSSLRALGRLGRVSSQRSSSRDVTTQVADVSSRVTSAQTAIARLRTLYARSAKVSDVIAVEQELATREADLEALQAQQRSLSGQTSLATISVSLQTAPRQHAAATHHRGGFVGGLQSGWHAFRHAGSALAKGVGAALPFALAVLLVAAGLRLLWPRLRSRRPEAD